MGRAWIFIGVIYLSACGGGKTAEEDHHDPDAGTCEADLKTDPQNCGECGHSCQSGACKAGQCQPFLLTSFQAQKLLNLEGDATTIVFTEYSGGDEQNGAISSIDLQTGTVETVLANTRPYAAFPEQGNVYWTHFFEGPVGNVCCTGFLRSMPLDGDTPTDLASGLYPTWIISAGDDLIWATRGEDKWNGTAWVRQYNGQIMSTPKAGGESKMLAAISDEATGIVATDDMVFWTAGILNSEGAYENGTLWSVPRGGGERVELASDLGFAYDLHLAGDYLYWVDSGKSIQRVALSGGDPETIAEGIYRDIAVDDAKLYWLDVVAGTVVAQPLSGGDAEILTGQQKSASRLLVQEDALYWLTKETSGGPYALQKLPK